LFIIPVFGLLIAFYKQGMRWHSPLDVDDDIEAPSRTAISPSLRVVAQERVPAPLHEREDFIGGIESITIAGTRYWFGFDYGSDVVLSPLISDPNVMAQFASDHMLQTTGAEPPAYWQKLVHDAIEVSELSSEPGSRDFLGTEIRDAARELRAAASDGGRVGDVRISYHLHYLLAAASESELPNPCDNAVGERFKRYGHCLPRVLEVVSGKGAPPRETRYEDALELLSGYISYWRRVVPGNWRTLLVGE